MNENLNESVNDNLKGNENESVNESDEKKIALLAIDIETTGPNVVTNEIISIGYCLGDLDGNVIENKRIDFNVEKEFDVYAMRFWRNKKELLSSFKENSLPAYHAIDLFVQRLDAFDEKYNLAILSEETGIEISLIQTEANVGSFNVDILAEEENSGRKIVIENQLGSEEHTSELQSQR